MIGRPGRVLEKTQLLPLSVRLPEMADQVGCFQLRPRSTTKEKRLADEWTSLLCHPHKLEARIPRVFFHETALKLAMSAFPHPGTDLTMCPAPERFLPGVPSGDPPVEQRAAERMWAHTAWVLETFGPSVWPGFHQTVRVVVQACSSTLFPPHLKTRRHAPAVECLYAAALGINELMYAVQFPTSKRGATTRLLLPP